MAIDMLTLSMLHSCGGGAGREGKAGVGIVGRGGRHSPRMRMQRGRASARSLLLCQCIARAPGPTKHVLQVPPPTMKATKHMATMVQRRCQPGLSRDTAPPPPLPPL